MPPLAQEGAAGRTPVDSDVRALRRMEGSSGERTIPCDREQVEMPFMSIGQVPGDQVLYPRLCMDGAEAMRQLGLMPPPALAAGALLGQLWNRLRPRVQEWPSRAGRGGNSAQSISVPAR